MPREININEIKKGMLLVEPILNSDGSILLKMGTVIEPKHIKFLKMWGITSLKVGFENEELYSGDSDEKKEVEIIPEIKEKVLEDISLRMSWKPELSEELNLIDLAVLYNIKKGNV